MPEPCAPRSNYEDPSRGFNKIQEAQLKSRKRRAEQTDEDKWKNIYLILFPGEEDSIPDPCKCILDNSYYHFQYKLTLLDLNVELEMDPLELYMAGLEDKLPSLIQKNLMRRLNAAFYPEVENFIIDNLRAAIQESQAEYIQSFQQSKLGTLKTKEQINGEVFNSQLKILPGPQAKESTSSYGTITRKQKLGTNERSSDPRHIIPVHHEKYEVEAFVDPQAIGNSYSTIAEEDLGTDTQVWNLGNIDIDQVYPEPDESFDNWMKLPDLIDNQNQ
jgi:hypothetical protein